MGFAGAILVNKIDFCQETTPGTFRVGAGYSFTLLGTQTARQGWAGLEFASGIPGSVGGAVFMNAGATGGETRDILVSVEFVAADGTLHTYTKEQIDFAYRKSSFQNMSGAIVAATFTLTHNSEARKKQIEILTKRVKTQPYSAKSAGCIFVNPVTGSAGALIDSCGLKGMGVGGAQVSTLHANFLINADKATCKDMLGLIELVQARVKESTGTVLHPEVRYIPYE
jgi:UDP-N-acetylmuramate dehydrogenase